MKTIGVMNHSEVPARVCILGADLHGSNRGVLALGVSLARLWTHGRVPQPAVAFHYSNDVGGNRCLPDPTSPLQVEVLNCRKSPFSAPSEHIVAILVLAVLYRLGVRGPATRNPWLRSLLAADFIGDIRGGDSFSDIYGMRRFLEGNLPLLSVAILGRPYTLLPQTYGPFNSGLSRAIARFFLTRADRLFTRDRHCCELVEDICGRTPEFCPDVAFTLPPLTPVRVRSEPPEPDVWGARAVIGINVSGLLFRGGYNGRNMFGLRMHYPDLIRQLLSHLLTRTDAYALIIPHEFGCEWEEEASVELTAQLQQQFPARVFRIAEPLSERELKWLIGRTSFFVGSRMHACIAALSQGVPTAGLAYSDKFLGVFESAGLGSSVVDLRTSSTAEVCDRTLTAFEERESAKISLADAATAVKGEVTAVFERLARQLTDASKPGAHRLA